MKISFLLTFGGMLVLSCDRYQGREKALVIQPFSGFSPSLTDSISTLMHDFYGLRTIKAPSIELPADAFINVKSPRYRADSLIRFLKRNRPDNIYYILGLTTSDISTTKKDGMGRIKQPEQKYADWGIFGLGYRPGPSCIVSTFRLKHKSAKLFMSRFKKICVHEVGHNLGLPHCPNENCVMRDAAESMKTIDSVKLSLCEKCSADLPL